MLRARLHYILSIRRAAIADARGQFMHERVSGISRPGVEVRGGEGEGRRRARADSTGISRGAKRHLAYLLSRPRIDGTREIAPESHDGWFADAMRGT